MSALTFFETFPNRKSRSFTGFDKLVDDFFDFGLRSPSLSFVRDFRHPTNTNVEETDASYEISVLAPGLKKEDFDVKFDGETLSISYKSNRKTQETFSQKDFNYTWKAPEGAEPKSIVAKYEAGILEISVEKQEKAQKSVETIEIS